MAVAPLTPNEQAELNRLLEENAEIKERIRIINEKIALATGSERDDLEAMAQTEKIRLRLQGDSVKELQKRQQFLDYEQDAMQSLASMSHGALKVLQKQTAGGNTLFSLTAKIIQRKEAELQLETNLNNWSKVFGGNYSAQVFDGLNEFNVWIPEEFKKFWYKSFNYTIKTYNSHWPDVYPSSDCY
jgi:hypothetical protein